MGLFGEIHPEWRVLFEYEGRLYETEPKVWLREAVAEASDLIREGYSVVAVADGVGRFERDALAYLLRDAA